MYSSGNHEGLEKVISIHTIYCKSFSHLLFLHIHSDGIHEVETVDWTDLKEHNVYSSGNHEGLEKFISAHTGSPNPKVVNSVNSLFILRYYPVFHVIFKHNIMSFYTHLFKNKCLFLHKKHLP